MTDKEISAATKAVRDYANGTMYGGYISDDVCKEIAMAVLKAVKALPPAK